MKNGVYSRARLISEVQIRGLMCIIFIFFIFCSTTIAGSSQDGSCEHVSYEFCKLTYSAFISAIFLFFITLATYKVFIKGYLMKVECYKHRLLIYQNLYPEIMKMERLIESLKSDTTEIDKFNQGYNAFFERRNDLFVSEDVKNQFNHTVKAFGRLTPTEYPDPPETLKYSETSLSYVGNAFKSLRQTIETEIEKKMKSLK